MNENSNNKKIILIIVCLIAIICICGFIYFMFIKKDKKVEAGNNVGKVVEDNINTNKNTNSSTNNNNTNSYNETISSNINLNYDENGAFLMAINDIFSITGRGTVVTGKIERGTIKVNDTVQIVGLNKEIKTTTIIGIEVFRKNVDTATIGDNVGLILKDVEKKDLKVGQVLAKPNSIRNVNKFDAQIDLLTKEEGGRNTLIYSGYRPQIYFRCVDIVGTTEFPANTEMIKPGDKANITIELSSPVAMEVGTEFSIREGGKTVGSGKVTKIY